MEEHERMGRWPELLQQGAQWLAGAALGPLRDRLDALLAAYRREVRRAAATYVLCQLLVVLLSAVVGLVALTVMLAFWSSHRVLAAALLAAAFLLIAAVCALAVGRLSRPRGAQREAPR
ncbi:MAG TPA: hypothetical protein VMD56_10145 [Steroidobacteraceae bacterium]|nr:hypothetical protein [Steroidobacteraceae bacterium]